MIGKSIKNIIKEENKIKVILEDNVDKQYVGEVVKTRHNMRQDKIDKYECDQADDSGSRASCVLSVLATVSNLSECYVRHVSCRKVYLLSYPCNFSPASARDAGTDETN